jgi:uncharacterized damage-inducible protein DinB
MNFRDLYAHMQWADAEMWRAVGDVRDEKLLAVLQHAHGVQHAFLLMWRGREIDSKALFTQREARALQSFAREFYAAIDEELPRLEQRLGDTVHMPWLPHFEQQLGRKLNAPTVEDTLYQLPAHSAYHRGQANLRLREAGAEPPLVDFIAWVWFARPAPQWPV